jgi:hypothetical protein
MTISKDQDCLECILWQPFIVIRRGRVIGRRNGDKDDQLCAASVLEKLGWMDNTTKDMTEY